MSGLPEHNFPAFNQVTAFLRQAGFSVFNPAETGVIDGWEWEDYMKIDIPEVCKAKALFILPGWQNSRGAKLEVHVAKTLNKMVYDAAKLPQVVEFYESPAQEAYRLVNGPRRKDYGHPLDDYTRTAKLWSALLGHKLKEEIVAEEAIRCMIAVKLSRDTNCELTDNRVDCAGYAECLEMVTQERIRRAVSQ